MEKIVAAALKTEKGIYTGPTHFAAMKAIIEDDRLSTEQKATCAMVNVDGFITNKGRFVDRAEAFVIAQRAGQITDLKDPDANKSFYGKDEPTLDSGIVEYAASEIKPGLLLSE